MKKTFKTLTMATAITASLAAISSVSAADGRLSLGGSITASTLEPRVLTTGGKVTDDSDTGFKIYATYDVGVKDFWHIEGFYANLGSAAINTGTTNIDADVDYKLFGVSAMYKKPFTARFNGIAKAGYADVSNDVSNNVNYRQVENGDLFLGLGAEYEISDRLNIRGEYEFFDEDIEVFSAGLNYEF